MKYKFIMKMLLPLMIIAVSSTITFSQPAVKIIDAHELAAILDESLLIIDVRTKLEFDQGYIPGAINIDLYSKNFERDIENYDHLRPVYLYCQSGNRSLKAAEILISNGFKEVYSLDGGLMQWQQKKKPLNY